MPRDLTRRAGRAALLLGLAFMASACEPSAPMDYLNHQAGEFADKADHLWNFTFAIAVVIFVIVEGMLVFALLRFRHKPGREASQFHGNTRLEVILTLVPALILAGVAVPTVQTIFDLAEEPLGSNVIQVKVTGHQFWFEYEYPDYGIKTANELHIPTGQPVFLTMTADDVIHSFWVPRLAGTQDVEPGHTTTMRLFATEPDTYFGQCKEFCGLSHANMRLRVVAQTPDDFQTWMADQKQPAPTPSGLAAEGQKEFLAGGCVNCHAVEGTSAQGITGPNLTHFASRDTFAGSMLLNTPENVAEWLRDPPAVKPGSRMPDYGLSDSQIEALVAYLETLE